MRRILPFAAVLLTLVWPAAADEVAKVGAGGYRLSRLGPCKPLPDKIFVSEHLGKPARTQQWWSSLVWQKYSQPMFAHPLVVRCVERGLTVGYPGSKIHGAPAGIFGEGVGPNGDLCIEHSRVETFPEALCDDYSDWFVTARFGSDKQSLRTSFGHGSPFVFCLYEGGDPKVTFSQRPKLWAGSAREPVLGVSVGGRHYGLFGATGSTWTGLDGTSWTNAARGKPYFSVALLPDDRPQTLAAFRRFAYNQVTDTRLEYAAQNGRLANTYRFTVKAYEGRERGTVFALYPHQWKYSNARLSPLTYGSVRGTMKVGQGESFSTDVPIQGVLPYLPGEGIENKSRLIEHLKLEAAKKPAGFGDTYWEGKHLGRLASLAGVAEAAGDAELRAAFLNEIKRRLENWFTAEPGKDQPVFYYDRHWKTLIGSRPSYGSDSPLNDHHFHYGYFIRAAAEAARADAAWAKKWGPVVELVIRDVASPDRGDLMFPYLRCFDVFAGHSWASGDANFGDGNNQESASEAMNAWYGLILWGEAAGNPAVRDLGVMLFNTERTAIEEYWFDVGGTNFPKDFPEAALGMIWGGKGAYATWFSGDADCIYGINWLPMTPASLYLGRSPDYVRKSYARVMAVRKGRGDYDVGWGDLVLMFSALGDQQFAAQFAEVSPDLKIEAGNSRAFLEHWVGTLYRLGAPDASITADSPTALALIKDGSRIYAAYNYGAKPQTVHFSNGKTMTVPAHRMALQ